VIEEEEEHEPAKKEKPTKKPATKRQSSGVQIQDTPDVCVPKKKALAKVARSKGSSIEKGSKKSKRETSIYNAGSSSEGANFELETESDDEEEETQDDEYIHTPNDYVPTDDETNNESDDVTEEEYERINEELYGDVNVSLTDDEPADKKEGDVEMTVAGQVNVNQ
ncbi:hypothetical protein Tco_0068360, partial [Tanacetum coccineum]